MDLRIIGRSATTEIGLNGTAGAHVRCDLTRAQFLGHVACQCYVLSLLHQLQIRDHHLLTKQRLLLICATSLHIRPPAALKRAINWATEIDFLIRAPCHIARRKVGITSCFHGPVYPGVHNAIAGRSC